MVYIWAYPAARKILTGIGKNDKDWLKHTPFIVDHCNGIVPIFLLTYLEQNNLIKKPKKIQVIARDLDVLLTTVKLS